MKQKLKQKILGYLLAVTAVFSVFAGMGASAAETEQESVPGYTVTLQQTAHGKLSFRDISGDQGQFEKDAEVALNASADSGFQIRSIYLREAAADEPYMTLEPLEDQSYMFMMPEADIVVQAEFEPAPDDVPESGSETAAEEKLTETDGTPDVRRYDIVADTMKNCGILLDENTAEAGAEVTFKVTSADLYEICLVAVRTEDDERIRVSGADGTYTFTMPDEKVFISAAAEKAALAKAAGKAASYVITTSEFRYPETNPNGTQIVSEYLEFNDQIPAFCIQHLVSAPEVGTVYTVTDTYTADNQKGELMRKILWYGWHGPGDLGTGYQTTHLACSVANGYPDSAWHVGQKFIDQISGKPAAPEGFNVMILSCSSSNIQKLAIWEYQTKGSLKMRKVSAEPSLTNGNSCYSLAGAEYSVYTDADCKNKAAVLVTGEDGVSNTAEVNEGTYYAKETKAPKGYLKDTQIYTVHVEAGKTAEFSAVEMPAGDAGVLELTKINAKGGLVPPLSGAWFTVNYYDGYYDKGNLPDRPVRTWVLQTKAETSSGKDVYLCRFDDAYKISGDAFYEIDGNPVLPLGTITVEETKAPAGYVLADGYLQAQGSSEKISGMYVSQITMENGTAKLSGGNRYTAADEPTEVGILKVDQKSQGVSGATLRVTDSSGKVIDEWVSDGKAHPIEGLEVGKTYTLSEIKVPDGYATAKPVTFTVKDTSEVQAVTMENEKTTYRINKVNEEGKGLAGATLRVTDSSGKKIDEWVSDGKAHEIRGLIIGKTYTLSEIKVPAGYATAKPATFTVKDTNEVQTVTMKNEKTSYKINKVDEEGKGLAGATLRVTDSSGKKIDEWVSDGKAHTIEGLTAGMTYTLSEIKVPAGYVTAKPVKFTVKDTSEVQTVTMENKKTRVEIFKIDAETGENVSNAQLAVYPAEDSNHADAQEAYIEFLTENSPKEIMQIPIGAYVLRELSAPEEQGYVTAADVAFEVKDTYEIQSVTMEEDYTKIDISKKDITGEEELPGAHLKLLDDENNVIDQWVSGENPHRIERLAPSKTYTLVEEIPADGYSTAESIEFTVEDSGEIQTVVMNDDITRIEIHKVDEQGRSLAGASLCITDASGSIVDEWTSDTEPHLVEKLCVGQTYTLSEINPPKGYAASEDIAFTVEDTSQIQKIVMTDLELSVPEAPKTGDTFNPLLAAAGIVISAGAVLTLVILNKKSGRKKK